MSTLNVVYESIKNIQNIKTVFNDSNKENYTTSLAVSCSNDFERRKQSLALARMLLLLLLVSGFQAEHFFDLEKVKSISFLCQIPTASWLIRSLFIKSGKSLTIRRGTCDGNVGLLL
jgi:hypothetical protein